MNRDGSKDKLVKRWEAIFNQQNIQLDHQTENNTKFDDLIDGNQNFGSLLPIVMRVTSQTIGTNLVNIQPMMAEASEEVINEVKATNRERKIESIVDDEEFKEMKVEDHPDFGKELPKGKLFYLDFQYGSTSSVSSNQIDT